MYDELPEGLIPAFVLVLALPADVLGLVELRVLDDPVVPRGVVPAAVDDEEPLVAALALLGDSVLVDALARTYEGMVGVVARALLADEVAPEVAVPLVPTAAF